MTSLGLVEQPYTMEAACSNAEVGATSPTKVSQLGALENRPKLLYTYSLPVAGPGWRRILGITTFERQILRLKAVGNLPIAPGIREGVLKEMAGRINMICLVSSSRS